MKIGVLGLNKKGQIILEHLLNKTAHNIYAYGLDGTARERSGVHYCTTAMLLCEKADIVLIALDNSSDLTALFNAIAPFIRKDQIFVDTTDISPAMAHAIANGVRRLEGYYLDCGIFGELDQEFVLYIGGSSQAYEKAASLLHCIGPHNYYMGPSGRGQAVRALCRSLSGQIQNCFEETAQLAQAFGIPYDYFIGTLSRYPQIAQPLEFLKGEALPEDLESLEIVGEMAHRAGLKLDGLYAAKRRLSEKRRGYLP